MIRLVLIVAGETVALRWLAGRSAGVVGDVAAAPSQADGLALCAAGLHVAALLGLAWLTLATLVDTALVVRDRPPRLAPSWIRSQVVRAAAAVALMGQVAAPAVAAAGTPAVAMGRADLPEAGMDRDDLALLEGIPVLPQAGSTAQVAGTGEGHGMVAQAISPAPPERTGTERTGTVLVDPPFARPPVVQPVQSPAGPPVAGTGSGGPAPDGAEPADSASDDGGSAGSAPEDRVPGDGAHQVAVGENLWTIARARLIAAGVEAPDDRTVHGYWVRLIAANLPDLRSGDPDLIHPGDALHLPPVDPAPTEDQP